MNMPYDDNMFDVAVRFYLTCGLLPEACISHFKEMHRVLVPGGKAMMVSYSQATFEKMHLRIGADQQMVANQITRKLINLLSYPSQDQLNDAFKDLHDVLQVFFTLDHTGQLQRITDIDTISNGQAIWSRTQIMTFANYFYDDDFLQQQIKAAGLSIDNIESYYNEERRVAY